MKLETQNARHNLVDVVPLPSPYTLYIDPCGVCNFKCNFCVNNNSDYLQKERHTMMEFELFEKVVSDIVEMGGVKVVNLYNLGEPLLNPRFCDMVSLLKSRYAADEVRAYSNASLLAPELNQKIIDSGIDILRISLEALSREKYKEVTGVDVDYNKLFQNVEDLFFRSRSAGTSISVKLITATLQEESELETFVNKWGKICDSYWFENVGENSWPFFTAQASHIDSKLTPRVIKYESIKEAKGHPCTMPLTNMTVNANGIVTACCTDWQFATEIGNVRTESLFDIWNGQKIRDLRISLLQKNRAAATTFCKNCVYKCNDQLTHREAQIIIKRLSYQNRSGVK